MIVDLDYSFYRLGDTDDDDLAFGPPGTVIVSGSGLLVTAFGQSGPISLRLLVGDFAPGQAEDGWREEWESVQDVVVDVALEGLVVGTWEFGPSDPPSGPVVRPGRWRVRFHARGQAKVDAESGMTEAPLQEHLFLIWPADAEPGASPAWDEVAGTPVAMPYQIGYLTRFGRVATPNGHYRLTSAAATPDEPSSSPASVLPAAPGITVAGPHDVYVTTAPEARSLELFLEGSEFAPEPLPDASGWRVIAHAELVADTPVRLIDGNGQVPRAFEDPILPAGHWELRLDMDLDAVHDHRLRVWPAGARTRDEYDHLLESEDDVAEQHAVSFVDAVMYEPGAWFEDGDRTEVRFGRIPPLSVHHTSAGTTFVDGPLDAIPPAREPDGRAVPVRLTAHVDGCLTLDGPRGGIVVWPCYTDIEEDDEARVILTNNGQQVSPGDDLVFQARERALDRDELHRLDEAVPSGGSGTGYVAVAAFWNAHTWGTHEDLPPT